MENLGLWQLVEKTNPNNTKEVKFGRRFTAIDAHYQIQRATEMFGPCGQGWGISNSNYQVLVVDPTEAHYNLLQFTAQLWYIWEGKEGVLDIAADIELFEDTKNGWKRQEDSHKKVRTDAVTKGLSWLGFNADVFLGRFDDNKYVAQVKREFEEEEKAKVQQIGVETERVRVECRSCKAPVYWGKTAAGKDCPFDWGTETSHFTTCPNASQHSSKQHRPKSVELPALDELATAKKQLWSAAKARKMGQTELAVFAESQIGVKPESLNLEQARQLVALLGGAA